MDEVISIDQIYIPAKYHWTLLLFLVTVVYQLATIKAALEKKLDTIFAFMEVSNKDRSSLHKDVDQLKVRVTDLETAINSND
jgi:hypothetical protein